MGAGKFLSVLAGILTLVATYFLSWYAFIFFMVTVYIGGIGLIKNLPDMFTNADAYATTLGTETFVIYIIAVVMILFLISFIFQLAGVKSRALVIIGSILPLLIGIYLLLFGFDILPVELDIYTIIFWDADPLVEGIIPLKILDLNTVDIGTYVLIAGGFLGIIAGIAGRD